MKKENNSVNETVDDKLTFNKLISFGFVTDRNEKRRMCHLLMRKEDLEEELVFQRCNVNSDVALLKESLFQLKRTSEKKENFKNNIVEDVCVEYNSLFNLYHVVSKKYLTIEKNSSKTYNLKLNPDVSHVTPFSIKRIVDSKSNTTSVKMNEIVYLCGYIKEKSQYYFMDVKMQYDDKVKDEIQSGTRISTKESRESLSSSLKGTLKIMLTQNFTSKFCLIDNSRYKETMMNYLSPGDIINICFSSINQTTEMLCVKNTHKENTNLFKLKEEQREDINKFKMNTFEDEMRIIEKTTYMNKINIREETYEVISCQFFEDIYNHVKHNSFWVLEKDYGDDKEPIKNRDRVRIKNVLLNLYLAVTV